MLSLMSSFFLAHDREKLSQSFSGAAQSGRALEFAQGKLEAQFDNLFSRIGDLRFELVLSQVSHLFDFHLTS